MEIAVKTKRVRGEGSILRKKGSRFLWIGYYDETGRQIQENSRTTSEREASGFFAASAPGDRTGSACRGGA